MKFSDQAPRRPAHDPPVPIDVPPLANGRAEASLLPRRPAPDAVLADVVGDVLRALEDAPGAVRHRVVQRPHLREAEPGAAKVRLDGPAVAVGRGGAVPGSAVASAAGARLRLGGALRVEVAGVGEDAARVVPREVLALGGQLALELTHLDALRKNGEDKMLH